MQLAVQGPPPHDTLVPAHVSEPCLHAIAQAPGPAPHWSCASSHPSPCAHESVHACAGGQRTTVSRHASVPEQLISHA